MAYVKDFNPTLWRSGKMGKGRPNPMAASLYRVCVEEIATGRSIYVTPAMLKTSCEGFAAEVKKQIKAGFERNWSNPSVVLCLPGVSDTLQRM